MAVQRSDSNGPAKTENLDLVLWDITLTNYSDTGVDLEKSAVSLVDGSGRVFKPTEDTRGYLENAKNLPWYETAPGKTRRGAVIFSVPSGSSCSALRIQDSDFLFH